MFDFENNEALGSIPAGGIYFSAPIWHHFPMPESTVCLSGLSVLRAFQFFTSSKSQYKFI